MESILKNSKNDSKDLKDQFSRGLIDYDIYTMSNKEKILYCLAAAAVLFIIGYIFYHSIVLSLLLTPFALLYPKIRTREIIEARKNDLNIQFRDMLYSLSSSLSAGKSIESSFKESLKDLAILYPNPDTYIIREVEYIVRRLEMNETIESALEDFALRSHLEDIQNFSDVFKTCKRTGGNLVEVIKNTSNIINDKIEIKLEITTILSAKKFEQKVLTVMPIFLIVVLSISSADYMQPVFTELAGRVVMTVAVMLIVAGYFIAKKIMNIKV